MNVKTETQGSTLDTLKLLLSVLVLIGGVIGFYILEAQPLWARLLGLLVVVAVAVLIALQTLPGRRLKSFFSATKIEVRKVVWPSRQETMQTTLVIFIAVLLTSLFMWAVDSILFVLVRYFTGHGG